MSLKSTSLHGIALSLFATLSVAQAQQPAAPAAPVCPGNSAADQAKCFKLPVRGAPNSTELGAARATPPVSSARLFHPPLRGAPIISDTGGSRGRPVSGAGAETAQGKVAILAPGDFAGQTIRDQPTLYWFSSAPITLPVEITLTSDALTEPLIDKMLPLPQPAGIHAIDLAGSSAHLQPGQVYHWAVSIILDSKSRSADIVSGSDIQRVDGPDPGPDTRSLARAGLWYDALDAAVKKEPQLRAQLLREIGLTEPAEKIGAVQPASVNTAQ